MKKLIISASILSLSPSIYAQKHSSLFMEFEAQHQENLKKLSSWQEHNTGKNIKSLKSRIATFVGKTPLFWKSEDSRANAASHIPALQNGTLYGVSSEIDGSGVEILVMDSGKIFDFHNEFSDTNRVKFLDDATLPYTAHATMVSGVVGATGQNENAKGVLPKATLRGYSFHATSLGTNYQKLQTAENVNISNHSYGTNLGWFKNENGWYWFGDYDLYKTYKKDTYSGSYHTLDANYDKIVYNNPKHVIIKSSGNSFGLGPKNQDTKYRIDNTTGAYIPFAPNEEIPPANCSEGYFCMGWGALAKNIITVGAINQTLPPEEDSEIPLQVPKWAHSNAGPRKDGAIKPDLVAVGQNIYAPTYNSENSINDYGSMNGTSFASALVAGVAGAITQVKRNLNQDPYFYYHADELKALLIHTATDIGNKGPDVWYGWGLTNASKAAEVVVSEHENKAIFYRKTLENGTVNTQNLIAGDTEPLKVTLSWVDPAGVPFENSLDLQSNHTSKLINDLDLRVVDTINGQIFYPWKLNINNPMESADKGDNQVDNVEQVVIEKPIVGRTYRVEISHKNQLLDDEGKLGHSTYALVATGNLRSDGASYTCEKISLYPTRSRDIITVIVPMQGKQISILDMGGRRIMEVKSPHSQAIDIHSLKKGVYMLNVKTRYCNKTTKFIKD